MVRSSNWKPGKEHWVSLLDEQGIDEARKSAEEDDRVKGLTSEQINYLRKRAKTDLFFLTYGILGYDRLSPNLHGHLTDWMTRTQEDQYRMILLPRGHYKSTVGTISDSIRMALPNTDWNNNTITNVHPYSLGTNAKILLAHEARESASRFLFEITEAFTRNPVMMALFPECIPQPRKQRMNKWELELPRTSGSKEPTFDTIGTGGSAQGRHYNHIKLDDIIGEDARESPTVMKRAIDWFDNINSLLTRLKYDGWDLIGTRWALSDVYSHAMETYGLEFEQSILRALEQEEIDSHPPGPLSAYIRGNIENGEPVFDEEFTMEQFNILRKNPKVYAAQYANRPKDSGLTEFKPAWLKFYNVAGPNLYVFEGHSRRKINAWDLDRVILCDPTVGEDEESDEAGIIVTGTDENLNIYLLETIKETLNPPAFMEKIFDLYFKWHPRTISIEEVTFSAVFKYWFLEKCETLGIRPSIYPYKPGSKRTKEARIRSLTNYFSAGQVYILEGMHDFRNEYEWFPVGKSKHLLDALAQGPEVWTSSVTPKENHSRREAEQAVMQNRDALTGY